MADPTVTNGHQRRQRRPAARAGRAPAQQPDPAAPGVGAADRRGAAADRADPGGDLLRGHRRSTTTTSRCWRPAPSRRCRTTRATCPSASSRAASRPTRCSASCCCCATCWPARCSRSTRRDFDYAQPGARRLRAGRQPHRQHRGRELRPGARARHPPAAGGDPRALHAGAAGARAAADPADHRRARRPARPPADRAAAARHPHQPRPRGRDRHHRRADDRLDGGQPPRADRRRVAADGRVA